MAIPRRLVFGQVAQRYDRYRPAYPSALIDDLIGLAAGPGDRRFLEVGAGTGKATRQFAARGAAVLAIEPSPEMAAVARRHCAPYPQIELVESDFERWTPRGETFRLLYSAQAWHWLEPALRYRRAWAALAPGALLAAFWNRPAWGRSALRDALADAYRAAAPEMASDGPLHPANESVDREAGWPGEIATVPGFEALPVRHYDWSLEYSADDYAGLLDTLSEIRLLEDECRRALLDGVRRAVHEHGSKLTMPMTTWLCLARATRDRG